MGDELRRTHIWRTLRAWVYKGVDLGRPNWKSRLIFPIVYLQQSRRKTCASSGPPLTSNLDRRDKPLRKLNDAPRIGSARTDKSRKRQK